MNYKVISQRKMICHVLMIMVLLLCHHNWLAAHPSDVNLVTIDIAEDSLTNHIMFKLNIQDFLLAFPDSNVLQSGYSASGKHIDHFEEYLSGHFSLTYNEKRHKSVNYEITRLQSDQKFIFLYGTFKNKRKAHSIGIHNTIFLNENPETITLLIITYESGQQGYKFDNNNPEILINLDKGKGIR